MLHSRSITAPRILTFANITPLIGALLGQMHGLTAFAAVPADLAEKLYEAQLRNAQQEVAGEVSIEAKRQTEEAERQIALAEQGVVISGTPNAGPQSKHVSVVLGLGAGVAPAYAGSRKDNGSAIP